MTAERGIPGQCLEETGADRHPEAFFGKRDKELEDWQGEVDELHRQIRRLIAEREWFNTSPQPSPRGMESARRFA